MYGSTSWGQSEITARHCVVCANMEPALSLTLVLEEVAHPCPSGEHKLRHVLHDLGLRLARQGLEPLREAHLAWDELASEAHSNTWTARRDRLLAACRWYSALTLPAYEHDIVDHGCGVGVVVGPWTVECRRRCAKTPSVEALPSSALDSRARPRGHVSRDPARPRASS